MPKQGKKDNFLKVLGQRQKIFEDSKDEIEKVEQKWTEEEFAESGHS